MDGQLHRVNVSVVRPGFTVRSRRAYMAAPTLLPLADGSVVTAARTPRTSEPPDPEPVEAAATPVAAPALLESTMIAPSVLGSSTEVASGNGLRLRPFAEEHVAALGPDQSPDVAARAGWAAYQRGDLEAARTHLNPAAAARSAEPWVHYVLGMADYGLGQYVAAIDAWEKVRREMPSFEPVYFDLVDGYLQVGDRRTAVAVLRAAEERWASDPDVFNALGVIHAGAGSLDEAIEGFERAITVAPDEPTTYFNLAVAYERRYFQSRRYFVPTKSWFWSQRDFDAAIRNYQRYLDTNGPYADRARAGLDRLKWAARH
jgi:tetratricopeptide (TPR) repeat protein